MELKADRIKMIVTIIKRGTGNRVVDYYKRNKLHYDYICLGKGTATSEILDFFGLESTEKDIVLTPAPMSKIPEVLSGLSHEFNLKSPGMGIAFTVPLVSVSARIPQILCKPANVKRKNGEKEECALENDKRFELILAILNQGNVNTVIEAAKSAGARGGTLLHGRRVGFEDVENIFGFTIQPEKDIVLILADSEKRGGIMKKITEVAGINTECKAIVMSLPVDEIVGI